MRHRLLRVNHFVVTALVIAGALALPALAQPARGPARPLATVIGPYHPVPIKLPPAMNDPSFEAFRKQLAEVAEKKDRAALAHLVAANFWIPEDKDLADKSKPAIDNLAKAFNLNGSDGFGWEALSAYAAETTAGADPQRPGVICAPAEATFDDNAADQLVSTTHTDASDDALPALRRRG
jgi:hypothetical protein